MALSVGSAFVDILPNTSKFGPALQGELSAGSAALSGAEKFAKGTALALGVAGAASVKLAYDFDAAMRNVNSIAQLPEDQLKSLSDSVLDLAGPTAQAPATLAKGLYDLVSSGFDAAESMKILKASAFAATAGLTTTDVSTKAVAAVLNAYRLPASRAEAVSDSLFQTVNRGVLTFEDLATNIGDTLPFAASLGVNLNEVGAATATMTKQGLGASETFTRIRNLLQTMIKPSEDLQAAFKQLGVESGEELIKKEGLQGALEALIKTTDGSKEAVAKLFPNIRALGGALALTGKNAQDAEADLRGMGDSAGATDRALSQQMQSTAFQFHQLTANLQVLGIEIGTTLLPVINDVLGLLNAGLIPAFDLLQEHGRTIVGVLSLGLTEILFHFDDVKAIAEDFLGTLGKIPDALGALPGLFGDVTDSVGDVFGFGDGDVIDELRANLNKQAAAAVATIAANPEISKAGNKVGRELMDAMNRSFRSRFPALGLSARNAGEAVVHGIEVELPKMRAAGRSLGEQAATGVKSAQGILRAAGTTAASAAVGGVVSQAHDGQVAGRKIGDAVAGGVRDARSATAAAGQIIAQAAIQAAAAAAGGAVAAGFRIGSAIADGLRQSVAQVRAAAQQVAAAARDQLPGSKPRDKTSPLSDLDKAGAAISANLIAGIEVSATSMHPAFAGSIAGATRSDRHEFVITNWRTGAGYFRRIASNEDATQRAFDRQIESMRS